ncbi:MAG: hypothetical protein K8F91_07135 [Candidatus Obscuribacterales bacterium]|nr:hypothetical protein [Candidatus Obscuribacterales bacterium]
MELVAVLFFLFYAFAAVLAIVCILAWFYGLILAFRASVVLGIICFFIEPSYVIFGLVKMFAKLDLAKLIVEKFSQAAN